MMEVGHISGGISPQIKTPCTLYRHAILRTQDTCAIYRKMKTKATLEHRPIFTDLIYNLSKNSMFST